MRILLLFTYEDELVDCFNAIMEDDSLDWLVFVERYKVILTFSLLFCFVFQVSLFYNDVPVGCLVLSGDPSVLAFGLDTTSSFLFGLLGLDYFPILPVGAMLEMFEDCYSTALDGGFTNSTSV